MGKRELLLVVGFLLAGVVVYQVTAPPAKAGEKAFSVGALVEQVRRQVRGNRANADITTSDRHPVGTASELRIRMRSVELTVTGEERNDIASELRVSSNGYDEAEAQKLAKATKLTMDPAAGALTATVDFPAGGRQRATLLLRVPSRMRLRIEPHVGRLHITNVAAAEITESRGETRISQARGRVTATHRGGELTISQVESVKLTIRGSDVRLNDVRGEVTVQITGGELRAQSLGGPIDLDANGVDVTLEKLEQTKAPMRINAVNGTVTVRGVRADARIDGRHTEIKVWVDQASPIAIYNDGDETIQVTAPDHGFQLDAMASDGKIILPDGMLPVKAADHEQRASGSVRGGGPTITLRALHGDIRMLARDASKSVP